MKTTMIKRLLVTLLISASVSAGARESGVRFKSMDESNMPTYRITDLCFDTDGYLWMATSNGLCRHDGYGYDRFTIEELGDPENYINRVMR